MTQVMSPDSSYGRYDTPTPTDNMMGSVHAEREPELHIGMLLRRPIRLTLQVGDLPIVNKRYAVNKKMRTLLAKSVLC